MAQKIKMRLLRVGKHKDSAGKEVVITNENLKAIADGFSFSGEEDAIPDIISHDNKSPRVGFVKKVYLGDNGNSLFAESEIHSDFAQAIEEGFYPGVSARLNKEKTQILHVAHLGRQKPAIKGLGLPIFDFAENKDEEFIDFAEVNLELMEQITGIWANEIRETLWRIQNQIGTIFDAIKAANGEKAASDFSEADLGRDKELRLLKAENEKLVAQLKANKEKEASDFAEGLVVSGKILPRQKGVVVKDYLSDRNEHDFAEMKKDYTDLPVSPLFSKVPKERNEGVLDFSSQELADKVVDYQTKLEKEGVKISTIDALKAVRKGS